MITKILAFLFAIAFSSEAQAIKDPIEFGKEPGRTYFKWVLDINHDGIADMLVSLKETPAELKERKSEEGPLFDANRRGFGVYIGLKAGGYVNSKYVKEAIGNVGGGIELIEDRKIE